MSPGKPPPNETAPVPPEKDADTDVNQRTGIEDRATRDSFGDMDEAAIESNPRDNPAIVTAVRGAGATVPPDAAVPPGASPPQSPKSPAHSQNPPATDKDPAAAVRASDQPGRRGPR